MDELLARLASELLAAGLETAFGITGSGRSLALIRALTAGGARYLTASHEGSAAIMAGAASQVSGRPAASLSIKGPGLANMLPGIAWNHLEGFPALSVSEGYDEGAPAHARHKRLDQATLVAPLVKELLTLDTLDRLPAALALARRETPGPIHLELRYGPPGAAAAAEAVSPSGAAEVAAALERLGSALRPLLVVGSLAGRREWRARLADLRLPLFTTAAAKGVVDEAAAHVAGVLTGTGRRLAPECRLLPRADLVVGLGLRNTEVVRAELYGAPAILFDEVGTGLGAGFGAERVVTSRDPEVYERALDALAGREWGMRRLAAAREELRQSLLRAPWSPAHCLEALNALEGRHRVVVDTGAFCTVAEHLLDSSPRRPYLGSGNGRYMGTALPAAIGALAGDEAASPTFCVVGDGGIRTYPAEIKLAVREALPLCILFMKDGRYGSIAAAAGGGGEAIEVPMPSWCRTAAAMGAEAALARDLPAFTAALGGWDRRRPLLIEAEFDPVAYSRLTEELRA